MEIINDRIFTTELLKLRIESNKLRRESHDHIINWVDKSPFKNSNGTDEKIIVNKIIITIANRITKK